MRLTSAPATSFDALVHVSLLDVASHLPVLPYLPAIQKIPYSVLERRPPFAAMTATPELLQLYQHVALPRDVPGKEDRNLFAIGNELLARLIYAVKTVRDGAPIDHVNSLDAVRLTLEISKALNVDGKVDKSLLVKEIDGLGDNHALFLHVTEQNAALLVYKENKYV